MKDKKENVLIVGAGPTGLTLALFLQKYGIDFEIIDKNFESSRIPRAININSDTLEIFKKINVFEELERKGLKLDNLVGYWENQRIFKFNVNKIRTRNPYFFHLAQSVIEEDMMKLLEKNNQKIARGTELVKIRSERNSITAITNDNNLNLVTKSYSYIIGCDGGSSSVRDFSGIMTTYTSYDSYFVLMDGKINSNKRKENIEYFMTEDGYLMLAPLPDGKHRVIASFNGRYPGRSGIDLSENFFQNLIDTRSNSKAEISEINWTTSAPFYHRIARNACSGRIVLAGDALHLFSPIGGMNMNTGIYDAYCLAKAIRREMRSGYSGADIAKYSDNRLSAAYKILKVSDEATKLITRPLSSKNREEKFLPKFKNRNFFKYELPEKFSGNFINNILE